MRWEPWCLGEELAELRPSDLLRKEHWLLSKGGPMRREAGGWILQVMSIHLCVFVTSNKLTSTNGNSESAGCFVCSH